MNTGALGKTYGVRRECTEQNGNVEGDHKEYRRLFALKSSYFLAVNLAFNL
jgi:hypothetical protein